MEIEGSGSRIKTIAARGSYASYIGLGKAYRKTAFASWSLAHLPLCSTRDRAHIRRASVETDLRTI